jgi:hypothetical protein
MAHALVGLPAVLAAACGTPAGADPLAQGQPEAPRTPAPSGTRLATTASTASGAATTAMARRTIPAPVYGVTVDDVTNLSAIVASLAGLVHMPTTRIVFDEFVPAAEYRTAALQIAGVSYVMGLLLDSSAFNQYDLRGYAARVVEYLDALADTVDVWEIGNEINGEWLGPTPHVAAKIAVAYELVKRRGGVTALTLYYNQDCWEDPHHEMFTWAKANVPDSMKQGLDYVLVSYYEDDCNGLRPDWPAVFHRLAGLFPRARLGFGEVGTEDPRRKADVIRHYYGLKIDEPRYVGGHFWWYYKQDMVPHSKQFWSVLNEVIAQ